MGVFRAFGGGLRAGTEKRKKSPHDMRHAETFLCKTLFPPLADACASSGKVKRFGQPQRLVGMKSRSLPLADGDPRYTDDMEASPSVKPAALQPDLAFYLLRSSRSSQIVPISNAS